MRRVSLYLLLILCATAVAAQAPAPAPPALFYVHEEIAKPSMVADFEKNTKEFVAMLRGANIPFYFDAFSSDDFHYYFVLPMTSFGDIDKIMKTFMVDLPSKVSKEKLTDLMRRGGATMENSSEWVVIRRDDISYMPAKPRIKPEEASYIQWTFHYVKPGMEDMVDKIGNDWKTAMAAANINDGFTVYQAVMGGDLPLVVVAQTGKNPPDLASQLAKNMEILGEKGRGLMGNTLNVVRRLETKTGRPRPDLSNPAPKM